MNMENIGLLNLNLSLSATPGVTLIKPSGQQQTVSLLSESGRPGFALEVDTAIPYDDLSKVLQTYLQGRRFELSEGFIKQHAIVETCKLYSDLNGNLVVEVRFTGSFNGLLYLTGKPIYNAPDQKLELRHFAYDLKTKNFLLKGANWLFDKLILEEMQKYTILPIAEYLKKATEPIHAFLNREWTKGVMASGTIETIEITGIEAQEQQLMVRSRCRGSLQITLLEQVLHFKIKP